jgi:hypothetical protein
MSVNPGGNRMMFAVAADLANPLGPDGPPSNVTEYQEGSGKYGYEWVNYDSSYFTQYSYDGGSTVEGALGPGVTSKLTISRQLLFAVRHASGGLYSAWAQLIGD